MVGSNCKVRTTRSMQMRVQGRLVKGTSQIEAHRQECMLAIMEENDEDEDEKGPPLDSICGMAPPPRCHAAQTTKTITRTMTSCEMTRGRMTMTTTTM